VGADEAVIRAVLRAGGALRLVVFAVGGPDGRGFFAGSALAAVRAAERCGAQVVWWAGGVCSCSGRCSCLRSRLRARTLRLAREVDGLVAFVVGGPKVSPGSWLAIRSALSRRLPLRVFPRGIKRLPRWHGRLEVCWHRGDNRWLESEGRWLEGSGRTVWALSYQPTLHRPEPSDEIISKRERSRQLSLEVWRHLQFDSLNANFDTFPDPEPGEETEFELMGESDLDGAALRDPQLLMVGAASRRMSSGSFARELDRALWLELLERRDLARCEGRAR